MKSKVFDPQAYEIAIRRVVEDGDVLFKATVRELPDVAVFEGTYNAAYDEVVCVIRELHKQSVEQGRPFPEPSEVEEEFSGRITLRLIKTVHRRAAIAAHREGVSLNHFLSSIVSIHVGALFGSFPSVAPTFVAGVSDMTLYQGGTFSGGTRWLIQGETFGSHEETSVLSGDVIAAYDIGRSRVKTRELLNLVKTTQPRPLLPSELENSNSH